MRDHHDLALVASEAVLGVLYPPLPPLTFQRATPHAPLVPGGVHQVQALGLDGTTGADGLSASLRGREATVRGDTFLLLAREFGEEGVRVYVWFGTGGMLQPVLPGYVDVAVEVQALPHPSRSGVLVEGVAVQVSH